MKKIKSSCGGQGCEIKPYYMPMGISTKIISVKTIFVTRKSLYL